MDWTNLWSNILHWVAQHPTGAYLAIMLISVAESLALIGLLIPGTVVMVGIGALAGGGALTVQNTLIAAMIGAVIGDGVSYWLGHHYHQELKALWPFRSYPKMLTRGEEFFQRHGGKSVLLGRFVGPVRPIIPVIAGMLDMPMGRFLLVNVLSAIGWAFAYIIPGVVLGSSLTLIGAVSTRLSLLLLLVGLLLWLAFWLCRKVFGWLGHLGPKGERLLPLLCLALLLTSWIFLGVLEDLLTLDPLIQADRAVYQFMQSLRTPFGDRFLVVVTELGDGLVSGSVAVAVMLALLVRRKLRAAWFWLLAVGGGTGLVLLLKWTLHRPRPEALQASVAGWGFPSALTTLSVLLYGFLAILLVRRFTPRWRWFPFGIAIGLSLLIAFSRLYLGAHWLSDILGGLSLGWAWVTCLGIFYLHRSSQEEVPKRSLLPIALATLVLAGGWQVQQQYAQDLLRYQESRPVQTLSETAWLETEWQRLPGWRIDLAGKREQPLTFQWAGDPERLAAVLAMQGWARITDFAPEQLLNLFVPDVDIRELPVLPQLENGHQERLILSLTQDGRRLVLRLWPTEYQLADTGGPLWVGSVGSEQARPIAGFLTLPKALGDYAFALRTVQTAIAAEVEVRTLTRPGDNSGINRDWAGETCLLSAKTEHP